MIQLKHIAGAKWHAISEEGEVVKEFTGKKVVVEPAFEEWLNAQDSVSEEDREQDAVEEERRVESGEHAKTVNLPNPDTLKGRAKTAALNAQVDSTFVEGEYKLKSGLQNEANMVHNVPAGWQVGWATPRTVDGGRHAAYLRERGYRPVYVQEMGSDLYGEELYVAYLDEVDSEFVFQGGAQLFIGPSERLAKLRRAEYDVHMAAFHSKQEDDKSSADSLGGELKTRHDSSVYNPMRS